MGKPLKVSGTGQYCKKNLFIQLGQIYIQNAVEVRWTFHMEYSETKHHKHSLWIPKSILDGFSDADL